nr:MAG TPA: hypothetical protein [Bacteriophage sp.]
MDFICCWNIIINSSCYLSSYLHSFTKFIFKLII